MESQSNTPLLDALQAYSQKPHAAFYAPGHKRGQGISPRLAACLGEAVFRADLPELPELDNLFAPQGVLQEAQMLAAEAFGAKQTWFLVNGSTSGVIAAILATCSAGDKIVLPRNVHQSAIAGLILSGAMPIFVSPEYDPAIDIAHCITPHTVALALEQHPDTKAVLMVSPTYYGTCGDVAEIAQITHQHGIPLLVDEAHGAHFAFHADLPTPALAAGADLAVQSIHKVLSAMTQAAMLHVQGDRIAPDRISKALQLVQSTSPSYLLLASLDAARHQMATQGQRLMNRTLDLADLARSQLQAIPNLAVLSPQQAGSPGFVALDRTRLTVTVAGLGLDGFAADEILSQQFGVTAELPSLRHLTFILTLGNTQQDVQALVKGFEALVGERGSGGAGERGSEGAGEVPDQFWMAGATQPCLSPRDAFFAATEMLPFDKAIDRISAELVCPYPPGIPVLLPGEPIAAEALAYLQHILTTGGLISGCVDPSLQTLKVVH